jgi:hypothetical protein
MAAQNVSAASLCAGLAGTAQAHPWPATAASGGSPLAAAERGRPGPALDRHSGPTRSPRRAREEEQGRVATGGTGSCWARLRRCLGR